MKKQSKIITIAISLLLLVASCIGITAFADGEKGLTVVSQNVEYADNLHLHYAVYPENVDIDGLVLKVYADDPTVNEEAVLLATVSDHSEVVLSDANGVSYTCRAFKTPGVALKNMTARFYVQAVAKDGTESPVKSYSVAEYFNEMMFGADSEDIEDYKKMLAAGDAAQRLLNYYPNDNKNDFPTNYAYVKVSDGAVSGNSNKGLYLKGAELSLTYNGTEDIKTWNLIGIDGNNVKTIAAGKSFIVTENVICVPSTEALPVRGSGNYAEHADTLDYSEMTATELGTAGRFTVNGSVALDSEKMYASVVDVDGDAALLLNNNTRSAEGYLNIKTVSVGNKYVFETDMMIGYGSSSRSAREILQLFSSVLDAGNETFGSSGFPGVRLKAIPGDNGTTYAITNGTEVLKELELGEWFNVRLEFEDWSTVGSSIRIYVNGELAAETVTKKTTNSFRWIRFWMPLDSAAEIYLDNTYFSAVTAE